MIPYSRVLKEPARALRREQTPAEQWLWEGLRRKQIHGVHFYRQKVLLTFIADFYCPAARLVIELDGQHHYDEDYQARDRDRDIMLAGVELRVLRFENRAVLDDRAAVLAVIAAAVRERL